MSSYQLLIGVKLNGLTRLETLTRLKQINFEIASNLKKIDLLIDVENVVQPWQKAYIPLSILKKLPVL